MRGNVVGNGGGPASIVPASEGSNAVAVVVKDTTLENQIFDFDIGATLKPIATFLTKDSEVLSLQMDIALAALNAFEIRYAYSADGEYITKATAAADFTTPNHPILIATTSFVTASVGNNHTVKLDVAGVYAVQLWASSGTLAESILNGSTK